MAARKVNWTKQANFERKEILAYWIIRNKSKTYSIKLNELFISTLQQISDNPKIGRETDFENVRVKIVRDYLLFYEYDINQIKVLSLWDGRRDDSTIPIK